MSDYVDTVDIEGVQYDIQDTETKTTADQNKQDIEALQGAIDYSTTEHLTGRKWIDGRPTYEKTIDCGALPNSAEKNVPHGISNLLFIVKGHLTAKDPSSEIYIPDSFPYTTNTGNIGFFIYGSNIVLCTGRDRTGFVQTFVTLEYTKSTDSPQP